MWTFSVSLSAFNLISLKGTWPFNVFQKTFWCPPDTLYARLLESFKLKTSSLYKHSLRWICALFIPKFPRYLFWASFSELEELCVSFISLHFVAIQISSGTRQPSAIQMRKRLEFVRPLFLDNSSSFITIDVKKMFQFHDFSELCLALYFSGLRNLGPRRSNS